MIEPIQLRFFRTPNTDGRPDFPWHAVDDLYFCLGLNRDLRRLFLRTMKGHDRSQTIATADGVVTIAPHHVAQGCINAMIEKRVAPSAINTAYLIASTDAMNKLVPSHLEFRAMPSSRIWRRQ